MALNKKDKLFIEEMARALVDECRVQSKYAGVDQIEVDGKTYLTEKKPEATVRISKNDLREASGRAHVRQAYLEEVAKAFTKTEEVTAVVQDGAVFVKAVPLQSIEKPLSVHQLKGRQAHNSQVIAKEDSEDDK
ncbi:MAG: hypothetical protein M3Q12_00370 [Pseudomonadota bacterium]|nr:hypothetical protein [Pseudomonadota bacterium]